MNDLKKQVSILIYPDGYVENIPITDKEFHIEYYKEHLNNSKRFKEIFGTILEFYDDENHFDFILELIKNGIIEICNMIGTFADYENYEEDFNITIPSNFRSLKQIEVLEMYLDNMSNYTVEVVIDKDNIKSIKNDKIKLFLDRKKELFNEEKEEGMNL